METKILETLKTRFLGHDRLCICDGGEGLYLVGYDHRGWDMVSDWQYVDAEGNEAVPGLWLEAEPFCNGVAMVKIEDERHTGEGKWVQIGKDGQAKINSNKSKK